MSTASIDANKQASKSQDALCQTLASQIEALNTEGVSDKVSKAAAKKYKMKSTDLAKADELNKANTEFQTKCSNYPPKPTVAAAAPVTTEPAGGATTEKAKTTAKAKPPVPAPKPVAAAMTPQTDSTTTSMAPVADSTAAPAP